MGRKSIIYAPPFSYSKKNRNNLEPENYPERIMTAVSVK